MTVRRHLAWLGFAQALYFICQFLSSLVVARLLSPYELGIYAIALAVTGLISMLQAFGLNSMMVRELEMTKDLEATIFTLNAALAIILFILIASISTLGSAVFREAGVKKVLFVLAFLPLLGIFRFLPDAHLQRRAQFRALSLISTSATLASQAAVIVLAFKGYSYMSLAYGELLGSVVTVVLTSIAGRKHISHRLGLAQWARVGRFSGNMFVIAICSALSDRLGTFALGRLQGLQQLGLYSRAGNLNSLVWDNLHVVVGKVVFVDLATTRRLGQSLRPSYIKINDFNTVLLWPAFLGLAVVSGPFIAAVYGERWVAAAHPLCFFCVGGCFYVAQSMTWDLFVIGERTAQQARIEVFRAVFSIIVFTVGCTINMTVAAASTVLTAILSFFLYRRPMLEISETKSLRPEGGVFSKLAYHRRHYFTVFPSYGDGALLRACSLGKRHGCHTPWYYDLDRGSVPSSTSALVGTGPRLHQAKGRPSRYAENYPGKDMSPKATSLVHRSTHLAPRVPVAIIHSR